MLVSALSSLPHLRALCGSHMYIASLHHLAAAVPKLRELRLNDCCAYFGVDDFTAIEDFKTRLQVHPCLSPSHSMEAQYVEDVKLHCT